MKLLPVLLALALSMVLASQVQIQVESRPGLTFIRGVPSMVTVTTPWRTRTVRLSRGTRYGADPQHYWSSLTAVTVDLGGPPGVASGHYPVRVQSDLYVCDQEAHLCSVRPTSAQGVLDVGAAAQDLTLTLPLPKLRAF